jgi:hypothetical protein
VSMPCKFERSIPSYDEHEVILRSHDPDIYEARLGDLKILRGRLRDKESTLARAMRREARTAGIGIAGHHAKTGAVASTDRLSWHQIVSVALHGN